MLLYFTTGSITTTQVWDGNGNLLQLIDDRGDVTSFQYDTMDRETVMTFHDGSTRTRVYDEANDVVTYTDENGSVFTNTYDSLGRKTAVGISLATGVAGTTSQSFQYDGLSRMTNSQDYASGYPAGVTMVYDSLSRVLEESQAYQGNTRSVTNAAFTSSPLTGFTFPNGRQLANTYDVLYRRTVVFDVTNTEYVAVWSFFGPQRVAEVWLGSSGNVIWSWLNNARTNSAVQSSVSNPNWGNQSSDRLGYDGSGRPITKRFLSGGINGTTHAYNDTTAAVGFTTAYDRSSNKLYERSLHCEERDHLYQAFDPTTNWPVAGCYDSLGRLLQYQRGVFERHRRPRQCRRRFDFHRDHAAEHQHRGGICARRPRQLATFHHRPGRRLADDRSSPAQRGQSDHPRQRRWDEYELRLRPRRQRHEQRSIHRPPREWEFGE